jgi:nitrite reductase (NADH) large subunit
MARDPVNDPIVIIGNGMVGLKLLQCLRAEDAPRVPVVAVGAEPMEAYNRIMLSSLLAGEAEYLDVALASPRWYDQNEIDLRIGVRVTNIDRRRKRIRLFNGERMTYSKLVLATGSIPAALKIPGHNLQGVKNFHNLADVRDLRVLAGTAKNAVVIGGGLLGLEAAHGLRVLGLEVTVVHLMDRLLEHRLDANGSYVLLREFRRRGIDVVLNTETTRIRGKVRVEGVELRDGSHIDTDLVVMAVGARSDIALAKDAGLAVESGVVVDDRLTTSDPDILAVGECAEHRGHVYGLVQPLYEQAQVCADVLLGRPAASYQGSLMVARLRIGGLEVFSCGDYHGKPGTEEVTLADPAASSYKKLVVQRGPDGKTRLVGAVIFGDTAEGERYLELITAKSEWPLEGASAPSPAAVVVGA